MTDLNRQNYRVQEYVTPQGCRVRSDVTFNATTGRWDETVILSAPRQLNPEQREVRRHRAAGFQ